MINYTCDIAYISSLVEVRGRIVSHMAKLLEPGNARDSELIDLLNHLSAALQQMEYELDGDNLR